MPINYYDLQRLAAVKVRESIRRQGSPDRFGKDSSGANHQAATRPVQEGLIGKLLAPHVKPKA